MSTATARRPLSRRASRRSSSSRTAARPLAPRFLVVVGSPYQYNPSERVLDSPTKLPDEATLVDTAVVGNYGTVEEALAECRRLNEVFLLVNRQKDDWAMIVVDPDGKGGVAL